MSDFIYTKICRIRLTASSSGMMLGSNKSVAKEVVWDKDGRVVLVVTEITGFVREVSTWNLDAETVEEIRATAERIDMGAWGALKFEEDPRFRCTDYSSSAGGSIIFDYRDLGGKPYEIVNFDQRAVGAAGKGEDLKALEDLLSKIADPATRASVEKTDTQNQSAPTMNGFMGMGMMAMKTGGAASQTSGDGTASQNGGAASQTSGDGTASQNGGAAGPNPQTDGGTAVGGWTCSCGTKNSGKYCAECGMRRPE